MATFTQAQKTLVSETITHYRTLIQTKTQQIANISSLITAQNDYVTGLTADIATIDAEITALNDKKSVAEALLLLMNSQ